MKNGLLIVICIGLTLACNLAFATDAKHPKYLIIEVTGIEKEALKNTVNRLDEKKQVLKENHSYASILKLYKTIPKEVEAAVRPYGYFRAAVHTSLKKIKGHWVAEVHVTPGKRLSISKTDIRITGPGIHNKAFLQFQKHILIKAGDKFNSEKYEQTKNLLYRIASARGYFKAKMVKSKLIVNLNKYTSYVVIHFETGPRYLFGKTTLAKTPFHESFLRRFMYYKEGEPYSNRKLQETREALESSNYFQRVIALPQIDKAKNLETPIDVQLPVQDQSTYTMGVGYGTDTGVRGILGMDYHWVNAYGHRFNSIIRGSAINSRAQATYVIPGFNPDKDQINITSGIANQDQDTGDGYGYRFGVSYQTMAKGWQIIFGLSYLWEHYNLVDYPATDTHLLYPSLLLQKIYADHLLNPSTGYNASFKIYGASSAVLSKANFLQTRAKIKTLFTLFGMTRILTRAELGYTDIDDINSLPLSLQLFAGGALSIRGFQYNSIGPGRQMVTGSFEIQQRIYKDFYLAGFIDGGSVSDSFFEAPLKVGVGPGIVWVSPLGTIELTVANAISNTNKPWVIQLSMGPVL
jgi:translocation and assembly module TamA